MTPNGDASGDTPLLEVGDIHMFFGGSPPPWVSFLGQNRGRSSPSLVPTVPDNQLGPGETGEVVVTLFKKAYCVTRFGTGDFSYYDDSPYPRGRISARLHRLVGRVDQAAKVKEDFIHPSQTDQLMGQYPGGANYREVIAREKKGDEVTFSIDLENEHIDRES